MNKNINDFVEKYEDLNKTLSKQTEEKKLLIFNKRFREYNPDQILFYTFNPIETFPEGSYERFLVDIIKNIDISAFAKMAKCDLGGPDEYNPRSMLAIIFYGESDGIFSSRNLSKLCISDQRYIFVSGNETPEHSTISRFINDYEKEIEEIFIKVLYIADNQGYIEYKKFVIDGSKFRAYASRKFTGTIEDFKKREKSLKEKISLAIEKQKEADKEEEKAYWRNKEDRYKKDMEKIEGFLKDSNEIYNSLNEKVKQNITDKDCRVMRMNDGVFSEGYNAQISTCEKKGIIISYEVTNEGNDKGQLQNMIDRTEKNIPEAKKEKAKEGAYIFDAGYNTVDNLLYCEKNNINAYIADEQDKNIYEDNKYSRSCKIDMIDGELNVSCSNGEKLIKTKINVRINIKWKIKPFAKNADITKSV
jgi:transposase